MSIPSEKLDDRGFGSWLVGESRVAQAGIDEGRLVSERLRDKAVG
jgi:hypothetical protein